MPVPMGRPGPVAALLQAARALASTNVEPRNCPHPDITVLVKVVVKDSSKRDVILVNPSVADNNLNV